MENIFDLDGYLVNKAKKVLWALLVDDPVSQAILGDEGPFGELVKRLFKTEETQKTLETLLANKGSGGAGIKEQALQPADLLGSLPIKNQSCFDIMTDHANKIQ